MEWFVEFYTLPNGKCPMEEFLDSLSKQARAKALFVVDLLRLKGIQLREPYCKKIGGADKLFELRFRYIGNSYRFFYFPDTERKFILLCGFVKKTEVTPQNEIQRARNYLSEYLERKKNGHGAKENKL